MPLLSRRAVLAGLLASPFVSSVARPSTRRVTPASLPRATPESQGVSSAGLLSLVEALDRIEHVHGLVVMRHGKVIAEGWWAPYDAQTPHELYSLSKSFTSTAVGLAVAEGRLSIDDPVLKHLGDHAPEEPSANLRAMRVRDLLCMSTGHQSEPPITPEAMSARSFLAAPVPFKPGTHFLYNTPATFMQSALVQKATGKTVREYLGPRLFAPLGIEGSAWDANAEGISLGGYGLRLRTEDVARFGDMLRRRGRSPEGKVLVPSSWVDAATARQVSNGSNPRSDWEQGYGYQFWRCRHGAYRGDGAFGQFCIVLPTQDIVVAITAGTGDMQVVLDRVWEHLLPAVGKSAAPARRALHERLQGLALKTVAGSQSSPRSADALGRTFRLVPNDAGWEALRVEESSGGGWDLSWVVRGKESRVKCGHGRWARADGILGLAPRGSLGPLAKEPLAASAAWTADDTLSLAIHVCSTPFRANVSLQFNGRGVRVEARTPLGFGSPAPVLMQSVG